MEFKKWIENITDPTTMQRNMHNLPRERLDFQKLNRKAVKITYPSGVETEEGFSIVTPFNRESWNWKINPQAEQLVAAKDTLNGSYNGKPNLDDSKYMQIVMSAKKLGLMQ